MTALLAQSVLERFCQNEFYQYALLGSVTIAVLCGVLSVMVVLKRMAFIGEGISHAAFGGVGVALLAAVFFEELRPVAARDAIVAAFCVGAAVTIGFLSRRGKLSEDTAIGIALVAAMSLGVVLLDIRAEVLGNLLGSGRIDRGQIGYTPALEDILFGDVMLGFAGQKFNLLGLALPSQVWIALGVTAASLLAITLVFKELVFFLFDEETAQVFGVRTGLLYYGLLVLLGLAVVLAMRSMGVILATALLVLPGASARFWSNRIGRVVFISALLSAVGMAGGFFLSIYLRTISPGPVIVLTLCAIFLASWGVGLLRRRGRS